MTKVAQTMKVPVVVGSITIIGVLTCCALLYPVCDLKATQVNVQQSLRNYALQI